MVKQRRRALGPTEDGAIGEPARGSGDLARRRQRRLALCAWAITLSLFEAAVVGTLVARASVPEPVVPPTAAVAAPPARPLAARARPQPPLPALAGEAAADPDLRLLVTPDLVEVAPAVAGPPPAPEPLAAPAAVLGPRSIPTGEIGLPALVPIHELLRCPKISLGPLRLPLPCR